jgi:hypothetical protein
MGSTSADTFTDVHTDIESVLVDGQPVYDLTLANVIGSSNGQSNPDEPGRKMFDKDLPLCTLDLCFGIESGGGSIAPEAEADFDDRHGSIEP